MSESLLAALPTPQGGFLSELDAMRRHSRSEIATYDDFEKREVTRGEILEDIRLQELNDAAKATAVVRGEAAAMKMDRLAAEQRAESLEMAFENLARLTNAHDVDDLVEIFVQRNAKRDRTLEVRRWK